MDSTTTTPIYFILSPGANVVGDLDKLADKYEFVKNESYHNVSMGQGQVRMRRAQGLWDLRKVDGITVSIQFYRRITNELLGMSEASGLPQRT